jgi:DNA-binding HxlR family transcriptional regulator
MEGVMTLATCTKKECSVVKTLRVVGSKWTILIIRDLLKGTMRFGELRKSLDGVSPKTLSERLKSLEKEGVVTKKIYPEVPPRVEYSLTKRGRSLAKIIHSMREWGNTIH